MISVKSDFYMCYIIVQTKPEACGNVTKYMYHTASILDNSVIFVNVI